MMWEVYTYKVQERGLRISEVGKLKKGRRSRKGSVVQFCTRINSDPTTPSSKRQNMANHNNPFRFISSFPFALLPAALSRPPRSPPLPASIFFTRYTFIFSLLFLCLLPPKPIHFPDYQKKRRRKKNSEFTEEFFWIFFFLYLFFFLV